MSSTVRRNDGKPMTKAERVLFYVNVLKMDEVSARELVNMEDGDYWGDVVELDENGKRIKPKRSFG